MKYYKEFLNLGCFLFTDACDIVGNEPSALTLLKNYINKGYVKKVRRGLYVTLDLIDQESVANKYQIASKISETAVVSHHSAFEFYGYANQVSYEVKVSSDTKFNEFEFDGCKYKRMSPGIKEGVVRLPRGIFVTDIERTVLDSINDLDFGFEELIKCITAIPVLNEKKMMEYLEQYDKCFLYQKTGFILEHLQKELYISDTFLTYCKEKKGNSSRYLLKDIPKKNMDFNNDWHLTVPKNLWFNTEGDEGNVDI